MKGTAAAETARKAKSAQMGSSSGMEFDGAVLLVEIDLLDGKHEKASVAAAKSGVRRLGKTVQSARGKNESFLVISLKTVPFGRTAYNLNS
jgi:hypothetical protein